LHFLNIGCKIFIALKPRKLLFKYSIQFHGANEKKFGEDPKLDVFFLEKSLLNFEFSLNVR
jgi:hypothetical protein